MFDPFGVLCCGDLILPRIVTMDIFCHYCRFILQCPRINKLFIIVHRGYALERGVALRRDGVAKIEQQSTGLARDLSRIIFT